MGKPDLWMPLYLADYLADTQHLTTTLHGAYLLLLIAMWMRGGRLPDDDMQLAAVCKLDRKAWSKARPVLVEFFEVKDGFWKQKRLSKEYEQAQRIADRNRENGSKGGRPRNPSKTQSETLKETQHVTQTEPSLIPEGNRGETPSPPPIQEKPKNQKLSSADADLPPGFVRFWAVWPRSERKQGKPECLQLWKRRRFEAKVDDIVAHVERMKTSESWRTGFDPMPATYLRAERWDGADLTAPATGSPDYSNLNLTDGA